MVMHHLILLCAFALLWLPGCASSGPDPREFSVRNHAADDIFREVTRFAQTRGFRPDPKETDAGRRLFVARWRGGADPIIGRNGGRRTRMHAEVVRSELPEGWKILYYFERQRVTTRGRGMTPTDDDWEAAGQDLSLEQQFAYVMSYTFHGTGIGTGVQEKPRKGR